MKKAVVIILVLAALIVLITPGIVGRLAEKSFDQNLELAVSDNENVVVSSLGFVRGWFTSEGQHRIELREKAVVPGPDDAAADGRRYAEALIVTTRIDHGLIPVGSMAREAGSLAPGLGSAVSTVSVEVSDGTLFSVPGTIYSEVGLTGELQSNFLLDAESTNLNGRLFEWGDADVLVTSNPASGDLSARGQIGALAMSAPQATIRIGSVRIDSAQQPGPFGYPLGFIDLGIDSIAIQSDHNDLTVGPMTLNSNVVATGDRVDADIRLEVANVRSPLGDAELIWHGRIKGADGEALRKLAGLIDGGGEPDRVLAGLEEFSDGIVALAENGMELYVDRLEIEVPQGSMSSKLNLVVHEINADVVSWAAVILALDGTLELGLSQGLVDWLTAQFPEFGGAVALGYLRQSGDLYETLVEIRSGVLTINGAPMQIPLDAF